MRLLIIGCEYAGSTTLGRAICLWSRDNMGGAFWLEPNGSINYLHDHHTFPHTSGHGQEFTEEEQAQMLALGPRVKEMIQRHNIYYHLKPSNYDRPDHIMVGLHIEDGIYGNLYFDYGHRDGTWGDRDIEGAKVEKSIMSIAPDTVLILLKASPEVIAQRMKTSPHVHGILQEKDIGYVLQRFEEEHAKSTIPNKFVIDTSTLTADETLKEFVQKIQPFFSDADKARLKVAT
jgi:hypothetical protein